MDIDATGGLSRAEGLDEDNLRVDPLEEGVEPPEHWVAADRHGMTLAEQREGEDLDHRLAAEEPDVAVASRPGADTPIGELSDRVDEPTYDVDAYDFDGVAPPERTHPVLSEAARRGQSADEAGGSVAASLRGD